MGSRMTQIGGRWALLATTLFIAGCSAQADPIVKAKGKAHAATATAANDTADRRVFFGELHLHTAYSFDAWSLMSVKTTPEQAYQFAQGQSVLVGTDLQQSGVGVEDQGRPVGDAHHARPGRDHGRDIHRGGEDRHM